MHLKKIAAGVATVGALGFGAVGLGAGTAGAAHRHPPIRGGHSTMAGVGTTTAMVATGTTAVAGTTVAAGATDQGGAVLPVRLATSPGAPRRYVLIRRDSMSPSSVKVKWKWSSTGLPGKSPAIRARATCFPSSPGCRRPRSSPWEPHCATGGSPPSRGVRGPRLQRWRSRRTERSRRRCRRAGRAESSDR